MALKNESKTLTAAECACRTGLTVRALRVYEELGLINPQRTASGWRYYGERELIRLNTITLLKSAGLTLAQIRTATHLNKQDPSLQNVLEMQVDAWKAKQADAARGQSIVEMALKSLKDQQTVSIDDLCNLVRSLEMSNQQQNPPQNGETRGIEFDGALLDRYVGIYRMSVFGIVTVTRDGNRLLGELCDGPIREEKDGARTEYRCRVGHAFSMDSFLAAQNERLERSLWAAVQLLEEKADLLRRVSGRLSTGRRARPTRLEKKARECAMHAATIRKVFEKLPTT